LAVLTQTEENYLKAILHLSLNEAKKAEIGTNELAAHLGVKPSSVNAMIKNLKTKSLVDFERYGKITLTAEGKDLAMRVLRKHRLWETFLHDKLDFSWDEVHEVAEQMEHIQSPKLIEKIDKFLGYPTFDPHGDPIPDKNGKLPKMQAVSLTEIAPGTVCRVHAVRDSSSLFLQHLERLSVRLEGTIKVIEKIAFDGSMVIEVEGKPTSVSQKITDNILVVKS